MEGNDRIAYCGLYCPLCSFAVAAETQDREHLLSMPERYDKNKWQPFEECECKGCRNDDFCGDCKMKPCAEAKGIISCADCEEFPCSNISAFGSDGTPHHAGALSNLLRIRAVGYGVWLAEMEALERCQCGARQSWYNKCPRHVGQSIRQKQA